MERGSRDLLPEEGDRGTRQTNIRTQRRHHDVGELCKWNFAWRRKPQEQNAESSVDTFGLVEKRVRSHDSRIWEVCHNFTRSNDTLTNKEADGHVEIWVNKGKMKVKGQHREQNDRKLEIKLTSELAIGHFENSKLFFVISDSHTGEHTHVHTHRDKHTSEYTHTQNLPKLAHTQTLSTHTRTTHTHLSTQL